MNRPELEVAAWSLRAKTTPSHDEGVDLTVGGYNALARTNLSIGAAQ